LLTASVLDDRVELRVVDRGPGIPEQDRDRMFVPFQRLGDTDNTTGVGLGQALSRGLAEAMGGTLDPEETPGGGLTMALSLPAVTEGDGAGAPGEPGYRERDGAGAPGEPGSRDRDRDGAHGEPSYREQDSAVAGGDRADDG
jgi:two-component system sensor histidine kinase KdpD